MYNISPSSSHRSFMPLTHLTTALNGYAAKLTGVALDAVRSDPNVEFIEQDAMFSSDDDSTISTTGFADPPPGEISQPKPKIGDYGGKVRKCSRACSTPSTIHLLATHSMNG
jgi:hypothetical protein